MERVQGIGGVFLRSKDREALAFWYRDNLGVPVDAAWFGGSFEWAAQDRADSASTIWSVFAPDTEYFGAARKDFMINFRVRDLDAMLAQLRAAGADVDAKIEDSDFGRFGWVTDPEGNRVELWQPPE
jgi:predicted enzyme related to lactoylglutathione lyase